MRRVIQLDTDGCGLACVASIAGVSYREVRNVCTEELSFEDDGDFLTQAKQLAAMFEHFGIAAGDKRLRFSSISKLPPVAILGIRRKNKSNWHWIAYRKTSRGVLIRDPNPRVRLPSRKDLGRIANTCKWYVPVHLTARQSGAQNLIR